MILTRPNLAIATIMMMIAASPIFAVGTVSQAVSPIGRDPGSGPDNRVYQIAINWTADATTGTVPATVLNVGAFPAMQGMRLISLEIKPGSPAPTNNYSITLVDSAGVDLTLGSAASLSSTTASALSVTTLAAPLFGSLTFNLSGNSVNSATGTVLAYFALLAQSPTSTGGAGLTTNNGFSGTNSFTGAVTAASLNNVIWLDGTTYAQTAAGLNTALTAAGTTKEVWVPSTATSLADTTISVPKGGVLRFLGSQTFSVAGIIVADSSVDTTAREVIDCPSHAKLQLAANSNRDVITDTNFLTLSGSGNIFGTYKFTLKGCVIDGNKGNQTALVTRTTGTVANVARTAGVSTINFSNSPSCQVGDRVRVDGTTPSAFSFNTVAYVQSATASQITYNQSGQSALAQTASAGTAICYAGPSGVKIYGRSDDIEDLFIANNVLDGLWTEGFQNASPVNDGDDTGCTVRRLRLMNSGGSGWIFAGPDGCQSSDNVEWGHPQWGREILRSGLRDSVNTSYLNVIGSLHLFGGSIQSSSSQETCQNNNCEGILIDSNGGLSNFASVLAAAGGGAITGAISVEVRSPGHTLEGIIQTGGTSTTGLKMGNAASAGGGIFLVAMTPISGASGAATMFDCTSETSSPVIILHGQDTVDTLRGNNCWTGTEFLMIGNHGSVVGDRFNLAVPNGILRTTAPAAMPILGGGFYGLGVDNGTSRWFMSPVNGGTPSVPVVGTTTTDTLTNKTLTSPVIGTSIVPSSAGAVDLGTTALPFGNAWLGTAATNNFKVQPAATTGARVITITDPVSPTTVGLPLTIASGTATMTTALIASQACGTVVTVAATGVATTDSIFWNDNAQPAAATNGVLPIKAWPTSGNVNFFYCNPTAAGVTPAAATLNWRVAR